MIHTGNLSYLNKVHREKYGTWKYWMKILKVCSNGKYTVMFVEKENETKT